MPPVTPHDSTRPPTPLEPPRPALPPPAVPERLHEALLLRVDQLRQQAARPLVIGIAVVAVVGALAGGLLLRHRAQPVSIDTVLPRATPGAQAALDTADAADPSATGPATDATPDPAPGPTTQLVVDLAGAVAQPGLLTVPGGSRVADALAAAGGPTPEADLERLNQAAPLLDGQRIFVPRRGEVEVPAAINGDGGASAGGGASATGPGNTSAPPTPIDLNTATLEELDALPGIGPSTAQAILDQRQQHGPFRSVEDLLEVRGIGDAKLAALRARVRV